MKVRIAVAMNADGEWAAWGERGCGDKELTTEIVGHVPDGVPVLVYFVEADIPIPRSPTIQGDRVVKS